jgi:broad specificity phosphatase PhoE
LRLYLLRHGEVASHRGDVPITTAAENHAYGVGKDLGRRESGPVKILSGETRRAFDTARHLAGGLIDVGVAVTGPDVAFALRNPDLYVAGTRVDMVSSPEALASQVEGLAPSDVASLEFFPHFIESSDRIGWWLSHASPPGDDAGAVATRVRSFAASLTDPVANMPGVVVAVTHSPLLRAVGLDVLGLDIGEPPWVAGFVIDFDEQGEWSLDLFGLEAR